MVFAPEKSTSEGKQPQCLETAVDVDALQLGGRSVLSSEMPHDAIHKHIQMINIKHARVSVNIYLVDPGGEVLKLEGATARRYTGQNRGYLRNRVQFIQKDDTTNMYKVPAVVAGTTYVHIYGTIFQYTPLVPYPATACC